MIVENDDDDEDLKYAIPLSPHSLQGLKRNDYPFAMAGLSVSGSDWIDRAEHVIGDHTSLRSIHIDMTMTESYRVPGFFDLLIPPPRAPYDPTWLGKLLHGVSRNRSIVNLTLEGGSYLGLDIFHILMPFFEENMNLQELEFHQIDMSQIVFQSFASALNKCAGDGYNSLTHISLCDIYCSDEGAAAIFEVLNG